MGLCTQLHGWTQIPMELASILVCGVGAAGDVPFQLVVCWRSLESLLNVGHWVGTTPVPPENSVRTRHQCEK